MLDSTNYLQVQSLNLNWFSLNLFIRFFIQKKCDFKGDASRIFNLSFSKGKGIWIALRPSFFYNPDVRSFCYLNNFFSCISVSAESSISREAKRLVKKYAYAACKLSLKFLIFFPWNVLLEIWFFIRSLSWAD